MKFFQMLLVFCSLYLMAFSCGKEELAAPLPNTLPPYTQEGKGVVACKINNQIWVSGGKYVGSMLNPFVYLRDSSFRFRVVRHTSTKDGGVLDLGIYPFKGEGNYPISNTSLTNIRLEGFPSILKGDDHQRNVQGTIEVRHWDESKRIVSGTFEYDIYVLKDTIRVREGRFDVQ